MAKDTNDSNRPLLGLEITRAILHEVKDRHEGKIPDPFCSTVLLDLDYKSRMLLQSRIANSFGSLSRSMEMAIEHHELDSTYQKAVSLIRSDVPVFIRESAELPRRLTSAQEPVGNARGGLLLVFDGKVASGAHIIGIIKAEKDEALGPVRKDNSLALRHFAEIVLSKNAELYKAAIYLEQRKTKDRAELRKPSDFRVFVFDKNLAPGKNQYFSHRFLGCTHLDNAAAQTEKFFNATLAFIQSQQLGDKWRLELEAALYKYVLNSDQLHVMDFATASIGNLRDEYIAYVESEAVSTRLIPKDISNLRNRASIRTLNWGKLKLSGPATGFDDIFEVLTEDEEGITVKIKAHLT